MDVEEKKFNFCPISSNESDVISLAIEKCLLGWKLDRVFILTVHNTSSNDIIVVNFKKKNGKMRY